MLCSKEWCRTSTTPSHKRVRTSCFTSSVPEREKTYISSLNEVECGEDGESIKQPRYLRTATSHMTTRHSQTRVTVRTNHFLRHDVQPVVERGLWPAVAVRPTPHAAARPSGTRQHVCQTCLAPVTRSAQPFFRCTE